MKMNKRRNATDNLNLFVNIQAIKEVYSLGSSAAWSPEKWIGLSRRRGWLKKERGQARLPDRELLDQTRLYSLEEPSIKIKQQLRKAQGEEGGLAPALSFSHSGFLANQQQSVRAKLEGLLC